GAATAGKEGTAMRRFVPFTYRRASLRGWWCWLLALAPLFSTVAFDTWLNTENLRNDYEVARLNRRIKELKDALDDLKVKTATLEALDRIETKAPDLDLIEPEPDQIQIIYTSEPIMAHQKKETNDTLVRTEDKQTLTADIERLVKAYILGKRVEETSWDTDPVSSLASTTPMEDLQQKAISSAYAYSAGDS
ncbi:MAG: hypothetical protein NTU88_01045, partial [Armatimonadetes bacterium]|nr:hypothetical protein [Armatimonadota bacterium]